MNGGRKLSQWNLFVKKIYKEGKAKHSNYQFKQALKDASTRKREMKNNNTSSVKMNKKVKTRKNRKH